MIQGFIDGIKNMLGNIGEAASNVGAKIKEFLHFSRPDKGPLREYEKWMPDMVKGLSKTLKQSAPKLYDASEMLAEKVRDGLDLTEIFNKMQATVDYETSKLSANLTTQATLKASKEQPIVIARDHTVHIDNTQNFYEKNTTPYEQQKQARQQLRRVAYGI